MKTIVNSAILVSTLFVLTNKLSAQNATIPNLKKWGIEFNPIWPFVPGVEIYTAKATRTVWTKKNAHSDVTFGILWRPGTFNDENAEKFSEIGANIGYRHYFWKGFHTELAIYPLFAKETKNKIDGKDYKGFALTTEFYSGYKFNFRKDKKVLVYLMPQVGIGYVSISKLGSETETNSPFPTLNLQVGVSF